MNDIDQLLRETEQDANDISAMAIRLVNKFGNSQMLSEFIAKANMFRNLANTHRQQNYRLAQLPPSAERNARFQILRTSANRARIEASELKMLVEEINQND